MLDRVLRWQYTRKARSNIPLQAMQSTEASIQTSRCDSPAEERNLLVFAKYIRQRQWDSVGNRTANNIILPCLLVVPAATLPCPLGVARTALSVTGAKRFIPMMLEVLHITHPNCNPGTLGQQCTRHYGNSLVIAVLEKLGSLRTRDSLATLVYIAIRSSNLWLVPS